MSEGQRRAAAVRFLGIAFRRYTAIPDPAERGRAARLALSSALHLYIAEVGVERAQDDLSRWLQQIRRRP